MGDVEKPDVWKRKNELKKDLTLHKRLQLRGLLFFSESREKHVPLWKGGVALDKENIKGFD